MFRATTLSLSTTREPLADALRRFDLFQDFTDQEMQWLLDHAIDTMFEQGELVVREGDEAIWMTIIVQGQMRFQSSQPGSPVYIARPGLATGVLPFSRLKRYTGNVYAITPLRVALVHREVFPEMVQELPRLIPRLIWAMSDRIRETTRQLEQSEKLKALGKLAAGLAHELNNPASAAQRSSEDLRVWVRLLRDSNQALADCGFDATQFQCLLEFERELLASAAQPPLLAALERSDREESLARWLIKQNVARAWEFAPIFVEANVDSERLGTILTCFSTLAAESTIARLAAALAIERLTSGIQASTSQIIELVETMKGYSFVDQASLQEVDVVAGIEHTLSIFNHRLRPGVEVKREYEQQVPRVTANGVELNQVWTHLIENALDAMDDRGTLRIRTAAEPGFALVEVGDNGSGIPAEIKDRIFDPFFTTKDVGSGRGLGLDIVFRVVQKYRGNIRFTSRPGDTLFQVRLAADNIGTF